MNQSVADWRLGQLDVSVGENPARKGSRARLRRQAGYMSELSGIIRPLLFTILLLDLSLSYVIVLRAESRLAVEEIGESATKATGQY